MTNVFTEVPTNIIEIKPFLLSRKEDLMHRRDCQRYLAGPVAKEPADPGGASPAHLGISDLHLARHGPRPIRCQKPARAESWKRWRVPRRLGHWLCPCPLAHFLRALHLRSFRVTWPRMRHKRATDECVLGFGRRQQEALACFVPTPKIQERTN